MAAISHSVQLDMKIRLSRGARKQLAKQAAQAGRPLDDYASELLEHAAVALRRVAHDYGNVLTTVLGFSELALAQPMPADSALHRYLTEVHRSAQCGAELTQQLRLFASRQGTTSSPCPLEPILAEECADIVGGGGE